MLQRGALSCDYNNNGPELFSGPPPPPPPWLLVLLYVQLRTTTTAELPNLRMKPKAQRGGYFPSRHSTAAVCCLSKLRSHFWAATKMNPPIALYILLGNGTCELL